jgi:thioesterase domain-containing protein
MLGGDQNFDTKTVQRKELLADLLLEAGAVDVYPASLAQERLWFLDQLQGQSSAYNVHLGLWLRGSLHLDALRRSVQEIVDRHDSLRTSFRLEGAELRQLVARNFTATIPVDDVTGSPEPYAEAYRLAQQEVETPFDLQIGPMFRARLLRVTPNDYVFLCTMHHIITDSWSVQILARELTTTYEAFSSGKPSPLSELPIGYGDYSEWQRDWFGTEQVQQQLNYWKTRLQDAPPFLELSKDGPRPAEQTFKGGSQTVQLPDELISAIKNLAPRWQSTPFMVLLAAFKVLLYRYSGQPDLLLGVPVAGRNRVETEGLIGFFVNTLVLRDNLSGNPAFSDLLAQLRETMLGAFANADVPFEKVVEALQPERNLSYNPIFQIMFSVIKAAIQSHSFGDLTAFPYVVTPTTSIFDLSATMIEGVDGLWFAQIDYNDDLFRPERIARMLEDYVCLLKGVTADPEACILDLPIVHGDPGFAPAFMEASSSHHGESKENPRNPVSRSPRQGLSLAPEERLLVGIWRDVLGLPSVGVHDNFFEVGGHSLLAARLIARIQAATGQKIPVSAIFRAPTIEKFARLLQDKAAAQPDPFAMKLNAAERGLPFFGVAIPAVDTTGFVQLARDLTPAHPFYKLQAPSPMMWTPPFRREEMQTLAKDYVAAMRSVQPHGPYCLGGMCLGVLIAQDMVLQLEAEGEEVALFTIFDTWVLENSQFRSLWAVDYYYQRIRALRSRSLNEQLSTMRRTVGRWIAPVSGESDVQRDGWREALWPGKEFEPPRFHAPILLFKRPRQPYYRIRDPQMGWADRSLGGVEISEIDCGHFEMFREPHVRAVAERLGARLQDIALRPHSPALLPAAGRDLIIGPESGTLAGSAA